jgi:hypothetical protein
VKVKSEASWHNIANVWYRRALTCGDSSSSHTPPTSVLCGRTGVGEFHDQRNRHANWSNVLEKGNLKNSERDDSFGSLGTRCSQNFCRRNAAIISAKKAVRFDSKRDDWCRLDNVEDMYDDVYEKLWEAGIAENLDEDVWRDKDNSIVVTQAEAYGRKTQYSLLHPEYVVMVDEVGEHISQKGS